MDPSGGKFLRLFQTRLPTRSLGKSLRAGQAQSPSASRDFQFYKRAQLFIWTHNAMEASKLERLKRPPVAANPKWRGRARNRMQVLIVEDHPDALERLERCLTNRDHHVAAAGNLQTALDLLDKQEFDAIISDIALPDGTGYALISEVRRRGIRALNIAMSGFPYPLEVEQPGVTGFHHHLSKPVNCDLLCSLLERKPFY